MTHSTDSPDDQLGQILARYLHSIEAGQELDRAELLRQHPDLASDLESFFRNRDAMRRMAGTPAFSVDVPTLASARPTLEKHLAVSTEPGTKVRYFGDYELLEEIARGGMGVVYKARQVNLKRTVALKMILAGQLANPQEVERFHAEAEAAAKLDHPGIVPIFEVGQYAGQHYFSMAFVEGESLAQKVGRGVLPPREAADLVRRVALAIGYAHVEGVVHRDLKPANILLDKDGQPRVTDFGLAKHVEAERSDLTTTGQILGTPCYMPPEQAAADQAKVGPLSDIYSLGAILYCLCTGRPPFQAATPVDTLMQVMSCEPASPQQLNPLIPRDLQTICLKCLEKEPARRYSSAQELADELQRFLDGRPIQARPISGPARAWRWCRRNPIVAGLATTVAASLLLGAIVSSYFAIEARKQAQLAFNERDRAEENAALAKQENARAEQKTMEAEANAVTAQKEKMRADEKAVEAEAAAKAIQVEKLTADRNLYVAHMNLLQRAWEQGNVTQMHNLLNRQRPRTVNDLISGILLQRPMLRTDADLRGFEWYYWQRRLNSHLLNLHEPFADRADPPGARTVAFSPDGRLIATGGGNHLVKFWNARDGRWLFSLFGHKDTVESVAFSPDSKRVASAGGSFNGVKVWDVETGKNLHTFEVRTGDVTSVQTCVAFSADGQRLAVGSYDQEVKMWDLTNGRELPSLKGHKGSVLAVAYSPDGRYLASGGYDDKTVKIWRAENGDLVQTLAGAKDRMFAVQFSPDSQTVAAGDWEGSVSLWNIANGGEPRKIKASSKFIYSLAFSPDGKRLATAGQDEMVRFWDLASGENSLTIRGHVFPVKSIAFSPDGSRVASASLDGTVKIWDAERGQDPPTMKSKNHKGLNAIDHHAKTNRLAAAGFDGLIEIWNSATFQREKTLHEGNAHIRSIAFSRDGAMLAAGGDDHLIRLWDIASGTVKHVLKGHMQQVNSLAFSCDGELLVSGGGEIFITSDAKEAGTEVKLWNTADGTEVITFRDHTWGVTSVAIRADGKQIASASGSDMAVVVRDLIEGKEPRKLQGHRSNLMCVAYSPDGTLLATASYDKTIKLWDAATGREVRTVTGHAERINTVAFSPDGKRLVSGAQDHTVRIWDVATGQETLSLSGHTHFVNQVVFDSDGSRLFSASLDGTVRVWDTAQPLDSGK